MYYVDSTINKLILLFVMDKMDIPLTENSIIDICTSRNKWLTYFDCKQMLLDLIDAGLIFVNDKNSEDKPENIFYAITIDGRDCLSNFYLRIPLSVRDDITNFAKENLMLFKRSQEYVTDYQKNPDGSYKVILKIKEPIVNLSLIEVCVKTPNKATAISTCNKWAEKAPRVFEFLYETLVE